MKNSTALVIVESPTAMSDIDQARLDFEQLLAKYEDLELQRDGKQLALAFNANGRHPDSSEQLIAKAAPYLDYAKRYARRAAIDIEDANIALEDLGLALHIAREKLREGLLVEAERLAETLIPRHRRAVAAILTTMEAFSEALRVEAELQAEFAVKMPHNPQSRLIPNMGHIWNGVRLDDPRGMAAAWRRAAENLLNE